MKTNFDEINYLTISSENKSLETTNSLFIGNFSKYLIQLNERLCHRSRTFQTVDEK